MATSGSWVDQLNQFSQWAINTKIGWRQATESQTAPAPYVERAVVAAPAQPVGWGLIAGAAALLIGLVLLIARKG